MGEVIKKNLGVLLTQTTRYITITAGNASIQIDISLNFFNGSNYFYQTYTMVDLINIGGGPGTISLTAVNLLAVSLFATVTSNLDQQNNNYYYCYWSGPVININYHTHQNATFYINALFTQ